MRKVPAIRLIARREFVERFRERSFAVSTAIILVLLAALIVVPSFFADDGSEEFAVGATTPAALDLAEQVARAAEPVEDVAVEVRQLPSDEVAQALSDGDLDAVLRVGAQGPAVVVEEALDDQLRQVVREAVAQVRITERLRERGLDPSVVREALDIPPLQVEALNPEEASDEAARAIASVGIIVLYGQLILYGMWVASGIVEEKSSRMIEVLLSTVRPRQLLVGKVLGIGALGLCQLLLFAAVGLGTAVATDALEIPASALPVAGLIVLYFLLGYAFYATAFAGAGARVSRQEDLQNSVAPLTVLILASFFIGLNSLQNPESTLTVVASYIPPLSTLVMPPRAAAGDVGAWQVALSAVLMLPAIVALAALASRIYAGSVLRTGARVSWRDAWRSASDRT